MVRYLAIHLPYLAAERLRAPQAAGGANDRALVLTRPAGGTLRVAYVCPRAAALGLRPGITLGEAAAVAPHLHHSPFEPQEDERALQALAEWALRFSPVVQAVAPDEIYLDITGCQRLFGDDANIARAAVNGLRARGFTAHAAVADTLGAARALAVHADREIVIVPPGQGTAYLAPLPPAALRIDPQTCAQFEALGIRSVGDLLMLPYSTLPSRFGAALVQRLQQALGEVFEGVTPLTPRETPVARVRFEEPLADMLRVQEIAADLLQEVLHAVLRADRALRRLECVVMLAVPPAGDLFSADERGRTREAVLSIALARASRTPAHVARLLHERLEALDLAGGVVAMLVIAAETSRWQAGQGELFDPHPPADDEAFAGLVDRLAARLGHAALTRPMLVDDYQPEMAFRSVPVSEAGLETAPAGKARRAKPALSPAQVAGLRLAHAPLRPLRLLERPIPIRASSLLPDGPPVWFYYDGREHSVVAAAGPERIETGWWRGPDVRRDYFRVKTAAGDDFWIFRMLAGDNWFVHGVFV